MTMQVYEAVNSPEIRRKGAKGSSAVFTYNVLCDAGETSQQATDSAVSICPLVVDTAETKLIRTEAQAKILVPIDSNGVGSYEITIDYSEDDEDKSQERPEPGTWHYNLDSGSATQRVTRSLQLMAYGSGGLVNEGPCYGTAIGWDGKEAKGTDISAAAPEFSITAYYEPKEVTTEFFSDMCENAYLTNSQDWLGHPAGTLLFQGMSGQGDIPTVAGQRIKPVPLTFKFLRSKNLTNIRLQEDTPAEAPVYAAVVVPSKKGWEYLDVRWMPATVTIDGQDRVISVVKYWAVHRNYEAVDYSSIFPWSTKAPSL